MEMIRNRMSGEFKELTVPYRSDQEFYKLEKEDLSPFGRFLMGLQGYDLYVNHEPRDRWEVFGMGYIDFEKIKNGKVENVVAIKSKEYSEFINKLEDGKKKDTDKARRCRNKTAGKA